MKRNKRRFILSMAIMSAVGMANGVAYAAVKATPSVPLNWTPGTAVVDGDISEWNLSTDVATRMCEAGSINADGTCNGKEQLSTLYARYNCNTNTMYVLVLKQPGYTTDESASWVKIYDLSQSPQVQGPANASNFHDVTIGGVVQGYEASFTLAAGTYNSAEIHLEIDGGRTSSTGKIDYTRSITVPETCTVPTPPTSGTEGGYSGFTSWGQCDSTMNGGTKLPVVGRLLPTAGKSVVDYNDSSVTGEVYNNDSVAHTVTLVSYKEFYPDTNFDDILVNGVLSVPGQRVNDYQTVSVPAGGHVNLTAQLPGCSTQIDLVCADVIQYLGNNNLYGARKLAYYHAHQPSNGWCNSTGVTPWNPPTNSGSTNPPAACTLKMDSVAGISEGQAVEPGTVLNIQGMVSGGTPNKVKFEISSPNGAVAGSPGLESYAPYYFMGDTNNQPNGWNTTGLPEGQYSAKVSVYDANGYSTGTACDAKTVNFTLAKACPFSMTTLTNVPTSVVAAGTVLNIGANVTGGTPSKVQFDVTDANGNVVKTVQGSSASIDTTSFADGQYTVKVSVFGTSAAACQTQTANFSVKKPCQFNMAGLTGVTNGAVLAAGSSLALGTTVTGTPTKVSFAVTAPNGTTSTDDTAAPYSVNIGSLVAGQYTVTAKAYDQFNVGTSNACQTQTVAFSVEPTCPFNMTGLSGVTDGSTIKTGTSLTIGATVTGTPSKVKFDVTGQNGTAVTSYDDTAAPYGLPGAVDTSTATEGQYIVKATAYDQFNTACQVKTASVNLVKPCKFNMTGITGVTNGATVKAGTTLTLGGTAANGTPTKVNVAVTDANNAAVTNKDGSVALDTTNLVEGQYTVKATGFDDATACPTPATATFTVEKPCKFKMDNLTGVTDGQTVAWGTTLTLGANITSGIPAKVKFELTGPEGVINSSDNASAPYSVLDTLDTSKSGAGAYTLQVSATDKFDTACATKQVSFNVVKSEWAAAFTGGIYPNDFCSLSKNMVAKGNLSGMALPQWVEIPVWIKTYDAVNQVPQSGLKVKVSGKWAVTHPSIAVAAEEKAANEVVCPDQMASDTCNAGQENESDSQILTSDASGQIDFTVKVWWPGITPNYVESLAANQSDESLIEDQTVETAYKVMVSGGETGNSAINDRATGEAEFDGNIAWNPTMVMLEILKAGSDEVIGFDGCVLTGVNLETR